MKSSSKMGNSLIKAIKSGDTRAALAMINKGRGLEERDRENHKTPLHYACEYGHTEVAMALMERGADIDARDKVC